MTKKKNRYKKRAHKKHFLGGLGSTATASNVKETAMGMGKDLLFGAVCGSLAGAMLGRSSLLVGIAVTGVGRYMKNGGVNAFGIGLMASGGYQNIANSSVNGPEDIMDGVKERLQALKENVKQRLFLDKIIKPKSQASDDGGTNGIGEVQYFSYPVNGELDMGALDRIESQIAQSARDFERQYSPVEGPDDISELNF